MGTHKKVNATLLLTKAEQYYFNTGFNRSELPYFFKDNDFDYVAYPDFMTHKKIIIHSLSKNIKNEIPLNAIINKKEKILSYDIINLDSILVMSGYTNHLYLLNNQGEIKKIIDFNPYLEKFYNLNYTFEMSGVFNNFMYNDTMLIISLTSYKKYENFKFDTYYEEIYQDSLPYFFKVDNIYKDTLNTSFGLYKFYNNFTKKEDFSLEIKQWSFVNGNIFVKSLFTDTVYVINPKKLKIKDRFVLKSTKIKEKIKATPITIKEKMSGSDHNKNNNSFPCVSSAFFYDKKNKIYFAGLSQKSPPKNTILLLDSNFNYLTEIRIDTLKEEKFLGIINDNNLILSNHKNHKKQPDFFKTNSFNIIKYEIK